MGSSRIRLVAASLLLAGALALTSSGRIPSGAGAQAEARAKIRAHLTATRFGPGEARRVKLVYSFTKPSKRFSYRLFVKKGSKWKKLRAVSRRGQFKGSHKRAVKKIFGSKPVKIGSYRLVLRADANKVTRKFRIVKVTHPKKPAVPVKLIFIHHSTGENWLADSNGGLGRALKTSNYFVSDTNSGWGPDGIGDNTDIGHWWLWFRGSNSSRYMNALYHEFGQHSSYSRMSDPDPGGQNEIVMFKSCFPNSNISGKPGDPPKTGSNPLRGQSSDSSHMTVSNVKGIYDSLLPYFAAHQDKLFVLIVSPPLARDATDAARAANARAVANWLMKKWLAGYEHSNVAVFDFYNVLTSNGGSPNKNDLGRSAGNHHRWWNGRIQHSRTVSSNYLAYPTGDSHPSRAGNLKATGEFVDVLNYYYSRWKAGAI
jgi:hypothetical protein